MEKDVILAVLQVAGPAILGIIGLAIRSYFNRLNRDIQAIGKDVAKVEGHLLSLQTEIRNNTVEVSKTSVELKAIWRFIDGSYLRASDVNGQDER